MNPEKLALDAKVVGLLPIVNRVLACLRVEALLDRFLPRPDTRAKMPKRRALGVLLRNLVVNRRPRYSVAEWAERISPELLGLDAGEVPLLNDDRIGRALDRLFDADCAALLTELVVGMVRTFEIALDELHNDSTTVTLDGAYAEADGRRVRGQKTLAIAWGHNKDHRPDLKQLLWILTVSEDGGVPVHFRVADGNTEDGTSHVETWAALLTLVGRPGFLHVADCKLCTRENMAYTVACCRWNCLTTATTRGTKWCLPQRWRAVSAIRPVWFRPGRIRGGSYDDALGSNASVFGA